MDKDKKGPVGAGDETPRSSSEDPSPPPISGVLSIPQLFRFSDAFDKTLMFIGLLGAMGYGITQPILSIILGDIVQPFIEFEITYPAANRLRDDVTKQTILFVAIGCGTMVGAYLMQALWSYAGERQARRVRSRFISSVMRQDLAWFDKNRAGDLTTQLTSDTLLFQEGISERFAQGLAYSTQFIAGFAIAFTVNAKLTGVLLATLPLFGISGVVVGKVFAEGTSQSQTAYAKAGALAQETLSNIRTVAAFGGQDRALKKFSAMLQSVVKVNERKAWLSGAGFGVFFGLLYLVFGLGFWYGGILVLDKELKGGDVLKVLFSIIVGVFSIINLTPVIQALGKGRGAGYRLYEVIDSQPTVLDGTETIANLQGRIRFEHVRFAYPSRPDTITLQDFSMSVEPGQTVALVGLSGSGKSTTIQLLERYYDVLGGTIYVDDVPLNKLSLKWWRSSVGLVSQEPILFDATIAENIAYGAPDNLVVTQELLEQVCKEANAHEFVSKLPNGYETMVGERGSLLSGGQKQRIALARSLIKNPRILLLDEATSALDTESEAIVQAALDKASHGRTTIVIAHRLSTIRSADKIVVMEKGKIVEVGTHESLIAAGNLYASLVKTQELKTQRTSHQALHSHGDAGIESDTEDEDLPAAAGASKAGAVAIDVKDDKTAAVTKSAADDMLAEMEREEREKAEIAALLKAKEVPLWRIFKLQWIEWPVLIVGLFMGTINGLLLPAFGIVLAESLTVFQLEGDELRSRSLLWFYVFLGLMGGNFVINFFQFGCFGIAGERLTKRIRENAFAAMLRQEMGWFDDEKNGTGALTARLSEQADKIQLLTGPNLANLFQLIVSMGSAIGIAFYYSWRQTLTVLACVPILALGSVFEAQVTTGAVNKSRKAYAVAGQRACDAIANISTVKSLTREKDFIDGYLRSVKYPYKAGVRKALLGSWGFGFSQAVQFFVYAIAFYAGYIFVRDDYMTSRDLFNCIFVILFGSISFAQAATFGPNIAKAKAAAIQYFELIDRVPPIDVSRTDGLTPVDAAGDVAINNAEFAYPSRPDAQILRGLDIQVPAGKNIALVGPSGSGKSSTLGLILRNYDVASGATKVEGFDVREWNLQYLRKQMAVVSQEPALFVGTIRENILYGVPDGQVATEEQIFSAAKAANIHDFIMDLPEQYETPITSSQLSGGQKQRICIARALIRSPKILLLDEATSALDSNAEKAVQVALDAASSGRTTITIAHRLSTIQRCDIIFVIKNGVVVEQGNHMDLVEKRGLYYKLVRKQQLGAKEGR
ncbi:multidrug resistance protein 1 [Catenaria anguillulae PL171]|uniref:Multidrug resistance protein 1 n=1 Tax=Catenaria anguillulae PL171 TaxID=765915 RepID=A0A1Y2HR50_9FUNG|nr:multidrug resistance protein 1 [Catenaria anguillulae PL171]